MRERAGLRGGCAGVRRAGSLALLACAHARRLGAVLPPSRPAAAPEDAGSQVVRRPRGRKRKRVHAQSGKGTGVRPGSCAVQGVGSPLTPRRPSQGLGGDP